MNLMTPFSWPPAPSEVCLDKEDLHVWCASLGDFHGELSRLYAHLSTEERARAARFHFASDRDDFVLCRGLLRELLGQYLRRHAATIEFSYGRWGKPDISGPRVGGQLYFNASHSSGLALYALTSLGPVGVDVERLRWLPDVERLASRFFAPDEANKLLTFPAERRMEEFFLYWTRKEAFLKATGDGIGGGLASEPPPDWQVQRLSPAAGYIGAVAYRHDAARLSLRGISAPSSRRTEAPCLI